MAHRYLCPICDKELTGLHYCKTCRKFVKEPLIFHGDSLPNEKSERDYSQVMRRWNYRQANMDTYNRNYGQPGRKLPYDKCHPNTEQWKQTVQKAARSVQSSYEKAEKQKNSGKSIVTAIMLIWFVIVFLFTFIGALL